MLLDYFGLWYRQLSGVGAAAASAVGRRKRQIYVEQDGRIHLFKTAHEAASWLNSQKESSAPNKSAIKPVQVKPKVIDTRIVEPLAQRYDLGLKFKELKANEDMVALWELAQRLIAMRDEEDVEILLLAGV